MVLRWSLALLSVSVAFVAAGLAGSFAADMAGFWEIPGAGFFAALSVVLVSYLAAPTHKVPFTLCMFALGVISAWCLLEPSSNPENYDKAYQPTHLPIIVTYVGGLLGLLTVAVFRVKTRSYAPS